MSYIIRVDDRLIHGQVVEGWMKPLRITMIVVSSDTVACDEMQQTLYEMAIPPHVRLACETLRQTAEDIFRRLYDEESVLVLVSSLGELDELLGRIGELWPDFRISPVNIGGLRHCGNKKQIYNALCLDEGDVELIKKILARKVELEYYLLPNDVKVSLRDVLPDIEAAVRNRPEESL